MTETASIAIADLTAFAGELADAAGAVILPLFRSGAAVENKGVKSAYDPVTEADRAAERAIRNLITSRVPQHTSRGEEFAPHEGSSSYTWVLDPIDGTRAFIMGLPVWSTLIGLLEDGAPLIGVMNQPFVGERFVGAPGRAWVEGPRGRKELRTGTTTDVSDALVATTFPGSDRGAETYRRYVALEDRAKSCRYGGDAYFYCLLAAGLIDIVVDARMDDYDIAALIPIVEGAGGVVTTWTGASAAGGGDIVAAATPALHEAALEILAG